VTDLIEALAKFRAHARTIGHDFDGVPDLELLRGIGKMMREFDGVPMLAAGLRALGKSFIVLRTYAMVMSHGVDE
jgi:hypothetical protein